MNRCFICLMFFALLLVTLSLLIYSAWSNSPVMSEDAHLASGGGHYQFQRFVFIASIRRLSDF
ncbi:MAG: hypothetical protein LBJ67_03375 [Planctomycetaceae bacterium]|jgi:hypothetical protein|nr:hypothetical protein [Planctomycetaceae bacterium]